MPFSRAGRTAVLAVTVVLAVTATPPVLSGSHASSALQGRLTNRVRPVLWTGAWAPRTRRSAVSRRSARASHAITSGSSRSARRHVQRSRTGRAACRSRCAGSGTRAAHATARRTGLLRRVRYAASLGLQGWRAARGVAGDHRHLAVGVHARPQNGVYDVWIAYDPKYNVAPVRRVRGTGGGRVSAADPPGAAAAARSQVSQHRAHQLLHAVVSDLRARSAARLDLLPSARARRTARRTACASTRSSPTAARARSSSVRRPAGLDTEEDFDVRARSACYRATARTRAPSGSVEYHGVHGHYHYSSFANAELWRSNAHGARLGPRRSSRPEDELLHRRHPHRRLGGEG